MIERYNPEIAPDPAEWLALEEGERHVLVQQFHRDARVPLPKAARPIHAAVHVTIENQLAMEGQEIVRVTLRRLVEEGLTRHEAIHAIGSVVAESIYNLINDKSNTKAFNASAYHEELQQLKAQNWRDG